MNFDDILPTIAVITVSADGQALLGTRTSVGRVMTKIPSCIYRHTEQMTLYCVILYLTRQLIQQLGQGCNKENTKASS